MSKMVAEDCASSYWQIWELDSGNVEIWVYEDAGHLEAVNASGVLYPDLPVCASWFSPADNAEVILLGRKDPSEW